MGAKCVYNFDAPLKQHAAASDLQNNDKHLSSDEGLLRNSPEIIREQQQQQVYWFDGEFLRVEPPTLISVTVSESHET